MSHRIRPFESMDLIDLTRPTPSPTARDRIGALLRGKDGGVVGVVSDPITDKLALLVVRPAAGDGEPTGSRERLCWVHASRKVADETPPKIFFRDVMRLADFLG